MARGPNMKQHKEKIKEAGRTWEQNRKDSEILVGRLEGSQQAADELIRDEMENIRGITATHATDMQTLKDAVDAVNNQITITTQGGPSERIPIVEEMINSKKRTMETHN